MSDALFEQVDEDRFRATELSRGPWSPEALHGGPVAALIAGVGSDVAQLDEDGLAPVRLTVELLRPVPVAALTVTGRLYRPGRKVRLVLLEVVTDEGDLVASASLLAIRERSVAVPEAEHEEGPPGPEDGQPADLELGLTSIYRAFHNAGVEHRFVAGTFGMPGPATDWIRLRVPVVLGRPIRPLERVAAAADFGNGISGLARFEDLTYINPDLTLALHRLPEGEWVCLDAVTYLEPTGRGLAESALWDEKGRLGRAVQTLIVDAR